MLFTTIGFVFGGSVTAVVNIDLSVAVVDNEIFGFKREDRVVPREVIMLRTVSWEVDMGLVPEENKMYDEVERWSLGRSWLVVIIVWDASLTLPEIETLGAIVAGGFAEFKDGLIRSDIAVKVIERGVEINESELDVFLSDDNELLFNADWGGDLREAVKCLDASMVAICDEAIVGWKILDEALPHVVKIVEGSL